jgi:hypothetical protein
MSAVRIAIIVLSSLVFGAATAFAAEAPEQFVMPQFPAGWAPSATHQDADQQITEYVPKGETDSRWESKITVEMYRHLNLPLDALQRRALAQIRDTCDGVIEGKFQSGVNNGFGSAFWTLGCKKLRNQPKVGETRYTKAIQSHGSLFVITRTWRTKAYGDDGPPISPAAVQEAIGFLSSSVVCEPNSAEHPCPATAPPR